MKRFSFSSCTVLPEWIRFRDGLGRRDLQTLRHQGGSGAGDVQPRQYYLRHHERGVQQERQITAGRLRRLQLQRLGFHEGRASWCVVALLSHPLFQERREILRQALLSVFRSPLDLCAHCRRPCFSFKTVLFKDDLTLLPPLL